MNPITVLLKEQGEKPARSANSCQWACPAFHRGACTEATRKGQAEFAPGVLERFTEKLLELLK